MPSLIISLPTLVQASSSVDYSTHTMRSWDVSDAQAITWAIGSTVVTTAPGPLVQVAFTSESTAEFFNLAYNSTALGTIITSSAQPAYTYSPVSFKQLRIMSTAVHNLHNHIAAKLVEL